MISRRAALWFCVSAGAGGMTLACRANPDQMNETIRSWFRGQRLPEPTAADLVAIRQYLERAPLRPDATIQPAVLFNPEVDLG